MRLEWQKQNGGVLEQANGMALGLPGAAEHIVQSYRIGLGSTNVGRLHPHLVSRGQRIAAHLEDGRWPLIECINGLPQAKTA